MAGRKTIRRHAKIKKKGKGKVGKRKAKVVRIEAVEGLVYEPVKVTRADYKVVEGFCRLCGVKIYGDISLINHVLSHDSDITMTKYLSRGEDERFQTISSLALKYLTAREPDWYAKMCNRLNGGLP